MHRHRLGGATDLDTALAGASSQALRAATIIRRTREMLARRDIEFVHEDLAGLLVEAKNLACMGAPGLAKMRSEEHTSELQSLMRISYAVFCLKNKTQIQQPNT